LFGYFTRNRQPKRPGDHTGSGGPRTLRKSIYTSCQFLAFGE
jgi:hypothetical protein